MAKRKSKRGSGKKGSQQTPRTNVPPLPLEKLPWTDPCATSVTAFTPARPFTSFAAPFHTAALPAAPGPSFAQPMAPLPAAPQTRPAPAAQVMRAPPSGGRNETSLAKVFETLAAILVPYARTMESEMHPKIGYCLKIPASGRAGREMHFGGVQLHDDGVAFHLFPLYAHPELLEGVSVELTNSMRGKTCFHIEKLAPGEADELSALTQASFERFRSDGLV